MPAEPPIKRTISSVLTLPRQEIRKGSQIMMSPGLKDAESFRFHGGGVANGNDAKRAQKAKSVPIQHNIERITLAFQGMIPKINPGQRQ